MQEEYTRVKPVDKERMSKYLEAAKGPGRTMKQFAEECGVNPSTFSRIVNKKLGGASTETVIRSIFEHSKRFCFSRGGAAVCRKMYWCNYRTYEHGS